MTDDETITVAVLAERVDNLKEQVGELRKDVKKLIWKIALIAGALGGGAGFAGSHFGG